MHIQGYNIQCNDSFRKVIVPREQFEKSTFTKNFVSVVESPSLVKPDEEWLKRDIK